MVAGGRRYGGGGTDAERRESFKLLWEVGGVREVEAAGVGVGGVGGLVGLYRLVASATLPPANQVRDKHKDD